MPILSLSLPLPLFRLQAFSILNNRPPPPPSWNYTGPLPEVMPSDAFGLQSENDTEEGVSESGSEERVGMSDRYE
jgi:hypothetical protein